MLEDFAMEKKSSGRSVPAPAKGNCTELKKNQEIAGGSKPIPRTVRRREPTSVNTRNDGGRRSTGQKTKYGDKRPRPKGQTYGSGKEDTEVGVGAPAEPESVTLSKKQSLNHLLNFHYVRREGGQPAHSSWRQSQAGWPRRSIITHKHKYKKEQFLQANCQFVVRHASDYMEHLANPDLLVDWGRIEQINFRTAENLSCPICLYPPSAAKMTRCGHIFCWSCILHYLALSDKHCRKCPICFESVEKVDLKSVVVMKHTQYSVGDEICLRLMKRERGSLLPIPVGEHHHSSHNKLLSVSEKELDTTYSKLLLATPKEVLEIIARERTELETRLISEIGCPEECFTEQALELLKERELPLYKESLVVQAFIADAAVPDKEHIPEKRPVKIYHSSWDNEFTSSILVSTEESSPVSKQESDDIENNFSEVYKVGTSLEDSQRQQFESFSSEGLGIEDAVSSLTIEDLAISQSASMANSAASKFYYFYQAADGQHVYLHAVNVRMLEHQYGRLELCPPTLKGRILEKESGSMTEELRHRLRYLQHLPVTCQFEVVEMQLKPPVISRSTVEYFQGQLEMRKQRRLRRARDERRREKRINDEERRRMGQYPLPSLCLQSRMQFPLCGSEVDFVGIPSQSAVESSSRDQDFSAGELNLEDSRAAFAEDEVADNACGPSFAQMLREGKSRGPGAVAAEDGRTAHSKPSRCSSDGEQDIEGYVPGPDYPLSEAITKAMQKAAEVKDSTQGGVSSGKKKKRPKQKVLFTTGMAFRNK